MRALAYSMPVGKYEGRIKQVTENCPRGIISI